MRSAEVRIEKFDGRRLALQVILLHRRIGDTNPSRTRSAFAAIRISQLR
jgi:hypothetical protein